MERVTIDTLYMHYFDVDFISMDEEAYPTYVLRSIDSTFRKMPIVPVVYITNRTLQHTDADTLADKIATLVDEIYQFQHGGYTEKLQIDCDWTESTKETYFSLLERLRKRYELSATIRLHQIKFAEKTGIPPVDHGILMVYNVGDIADFSYNSILEPSIVDAYIDSSTTYPLSLSLALPIFSQTVLKNSVNKHKIVTGTDRKRLENREEFRKTDTNRYEVIKPQLFKGFFMAKGDQIELENPSRKAIVESAKIIKESKLTITNTILYHLDDRSLANRDMIQLIGALQ